MYFYTTLVNMTQKNQILPGTDAWERICEQCGLCCLLKTVDEYGRVCLTRVRCRHLGKNRLCDCYNMNFSARNDENCDSCFKSGGSPVNFDTLCNDYVVPGFCPYVKRFVAPNNLTHPNIDFENTISENELPDGANLRDYIIPGTAKFFKYNPAVNKKMRDWFGHKK